MGKITLKKAGTTKIRKSERYSSEITIPIDLVRHMNVQDGDKLSFYMDPQDKSYAMIIKNVDKQFAGLGITASLDFPLSYDGGKIANKRK